MDIQEKIQLELKRASMSFDAAIASAKPIWEVMGMSEEKYFDVYMKLESPQEIPEQTDDTEPSDAIELRDGETGEAVEASP